LWRACRRAAESDAVAQEAIERLDVSTTPEDLLGRTDGEWVENTQFFKVSYIDANPQRAQRGANTMGELVSERCVDWASPQSSLSAFVWRRARVPKEPVGTLLL
jgi:capsular polysaccharide biosynthesis protein